MNFEEDNVQKSIRETVRSFAEKEVWPRAEELDRTGEFPYDLVKACGDLGIQGLLYPEELGGSNAGALAFITAIEEIARGDASLATTLFVATANAYMIYESGTPEMIDQWLKPVITGDAVGAFGLTEPNAGSDNRALVTNVKFDGDNVILNGTKAFITNAGTNISKFINVLCKVKSNCELNGEVAVVTVPNGTPGFTYSEKYRKLGWKSSDTREVYFDNCIVPKKNMIKAPGKGLQEGWKLLNLGRISLAASSIGVGQAALDASLKYAQERVQFGKPIAGHQRVQDMIVEMALQLETSRLLTYKAAWLWGNNVHDQTAFSMAKLYATEAGKKCTDLAVQVHGGMGFMDECPVSRYYRDIRVHTIGDGTSEIHRLIIAGQLGLRS
jgi:short-chain 2-methylacyl-CoA dehydrogenase